MRQYIQASFRTTTILVILFASCILLLLQPPASSLARNKYKIWRQASLMGNDCQLAVAVFGGSTTVGAGTTDMNELAWPSIFEKRINALVPCNITVRNFARGARTASYFTICFQRFLSLQKDLPDYQIVLLEFAINGGNVTELVETVYRYLPNAKVVLVKQLSCIWHDGRRETPPIHAYEKPINAYEYSAKQQQQAALIFNLTELDFINYVTGLQGNPCARENQDILFDARETLNASINPGRHHLGNFGSNLLGDFVADEIGRMWMSDPSRFISDSITKSKLYNSDRAPEASGGDQNARPGLTCYFPGLSGPCTRFANSERQACSLQDAFVPNGWTYTNKLTAEMSDFREDKVCWVSNKANSTLQSKYKVSFDRIEIFAEFSPNYKGHLTFLCDSIELGNISLHWERDANLVETALLEIPCYNSTLLVKNSQEEGMLTKFCGVAFS